MKTAFAIYREPLFLLFPIASLLIGAGVFLALALPLTWVAATNPRRLLAWRLQEKPVATRFVWPSLARLGLNLLFLLALSVTLWPLLRLSAVHAGAWPAGYEVAWQLPLFLVVDDLCFYFLHRSLHFPWLFKHVHAVHHRIRTPSAIAGAYFHPVEYALISLVASIGPLVVGANVVTIWIWAALRQSLAADGHSGYVLPWSPGRLLPGYRGPAFHDRHHQCSIGNYANVFIWFDRWFGTISPGFLEHRRAPSAEARSSRPRSRSADRDPRLAWRDVILNGLLRLHMTLVRWRLWRPLVAATKRPRATQLHVLHRIIAANRATRFGREHGFEEIATVGQFRERVPVQTYESLGPYIDEQDRTGVGLLSADPPVLYAQTSGTTGVPRYFPLSRRALAWHKRNQDLFAYVQHRSVPAGFHGRILAIVSPAVEGRLPSGAPFGAVSGFLYRAMPRLARMKYVLPSEVFEVTDYDLKYLLILRLAVAEANVTGMGTANPSTFLRLLSVLREHRAELLADVERSRFAQIDRLPTHVRRAIEPRLSCDRVRLETLRRALVRPNVSFADLWPHLRLVSTWTGGSCGIAIESLRSLIPPAARLVDLGYLASEFRGSTTVDVSTGSGVPTLRENFFEFVEKERWEKREAEFRLLDELEVGREYYVFATTESGLYRYFINDIVRVTGRFHATPTITFVQKGKGVTSITGEKLYESQVIEAVHAAEGELGASACFFVMLADVERARYRLLIECSAGFQPDPEGLSARVDTLLSERNVEYRAKRASGRLAALEVRPLGEGFGDAYRGWCVRGGQREGQFKIIALQYAADFRFDYTSWILEGTALASTPRRPGPPRPLPTAFEKLLASPA